MTTLLKGIAEKKTLNELAGDPAYRGLLSE